MRLALPVILAAGLTLALGAAGAGAAGRLAAYEIVDAREIPESLTGRPGDPEAGEKLYADATLTGCAGCHGAPGEAGGEAGRGAGDAPPLAGIGGRMSEGAIRLWIVAPQVRAPETRMPAYYAAGQRDDPADPRYGEPRLTAEQIEDLVAWLVAQRQARRLTGN